MKSLEKTYNTDIPGVYYNEEELKQHDNFMEKYVFPLEQGEFSTYKYDAFFLAYKDLPKNIKENLKEIYLEEKVLYFKSKINNIIDFNTYNVDHNSLKKYVNELQAIVGDKETNEFLESKK